MNKREAPARTGPLRARPPRGAPRRCAPPPGSPRPGRPRGGEAGGVGTPSSVEDQEAGEGRGRPGRGRGSAAERGRAGGRRQRRGPRRGEAPALPTGASPAPGEPAASSILVGGGGERRPGPSTVAPVPQGPSDADAGIGGCPLGRMAEPSRGLAGTRLPAPRGLALNRPRVPTAVPTKWRTSSPPAAMTGGGGTIPHGAEARVEAPPLPAARWGARLTRRPDLPAPARSSPRAGSPLSGGLRNGTGRALGTSRPRLSSGRVAGSGRSSRGAQARARAGGHGRGLSGCPGPRGAPRAPRAGARGRCSGRRASGCLTLTDPGVGAGWEAGARRGGDAAEGRARAEAGRGTATPGGVARA